MMPDTAAGKKMPLRFRYLEPLYLHTAKRINNESGSNTSLWTPEAFFPLKYLYYEHMDFIAGNAFRHFFDEKTKDLSPENQVTYMEQCTLSQYSRYWRELLQKYPVLKELADRWSEDFCAHALMLKIRLERDIREIREHFTENTGKILSVGRGSSDIHQGKCVHIIEFENGKKIVYKPRSLQLDRVWQDYLQDMALKSGIGSFRVPWIIQKKDYGYEEFISREPVAGKKGFAEYFYRCGFLLGIAYVLQGNDLHAENLIACGNHPVLIDLETGIRGCANTVFSDVKNPIEKRYDYDSVLRTNLLPFLTSGRTLRGGDAAFTADRSGLQNLPYDNTGKRSGEQYVKEIQKGFRLAYDTVKKHGITERFSQCSVRFLIRNTSSYADIQRWVCSPPGLSSRKNFEERLRFLEQLYEKIGLKADSGFFFDLLNKEKSAMQKGYIPRLTVKMSTPWNGDDTKTLADILTEKTMYLNKEDKKRQCKRIALSLNRKAPGDKLAGVWKGRRISLKSAERIMHKRISCWHSWIQMEKAQEGIVVSGEDGRYYLTILPWNMMEGIPGLLPALAAWHFISGESEAFCLLSLIGEKLYLELEKTDLKIYKPGLPEGLEGILRMAQLVRPLVKCVWIDKIYQLILPAVKEKAKKESAEDSLFYGQNAVRFVLDLEANPDKFKSQEDDLFESGFHEGIDKERFPSFFRGEGGWLYAMLRKIRPDKILPVLGNKI